MCKTEIMAECLRDRELRAVVAGAGQQEAAVTTPAPAFLPRLAQVGSVMQCQHLNCRCKGVEARETTKRRYSNVCRKKGMKLAGEQHSVNVKNKTCQAVAAIEHLKIKRKNKKN